MPDFVQIGTPSSTASSMEIGSTLIPDQVDWGTDLLNDRYVQTVQSEGGILAVELAPNRKITLPFIYKGTSVDDSNQFLQRLQFVTQPGNTLDVRPEGASWITRFDIEGGRVLAHRDIRYHRQAIMQGTLELSTRPWGYTATWMIAASVPTALPFIPFQASVIGDLPAHTRWIMRFQPQITSAVNPGGVIIGQHQMPSYRTIWAANNNGAVPASVAVETFAANPSMQNWRQSNWPGSSAVSADIAFAQMNVGGEPELQNMATTSRMFVNIYNAAPSQAGGYPMQLVVQGTTKALSRPAFMIKPVGGAGVSVRAGQLVDFGEVNKFLMVTPDGGATAARIAIHQPYDVTVPSAASIMVSIDALVIVPNANMFIVKGTGDTLEFAGAVASRIVNIDSKQRRMWRLTAGGSSMANDLTAYPVGAWPMVSPVNASGGPGIVVAALGTDAEGLNIPYSEPSSMVAVSVLYQPRWVLFR